MGYIGIIFLVIFQFLLTRADNSPPSTFPNIFQLSEQSAH